MADTKQQRAKIGASVKVTGVTVVRASGLTEKHNEEDAQTLAIKLYDKPNALRPFDILMAGYKQKGTSMLDEMPNELIARAAHFGKAIGVGSSTVDFTDADIVESAKLNPETITSMTIDYEITVARSADA